MSKPYPWYYAVNDRPVKIVLLPNGGADTLVFDWATGELVSDRSYFTRVFDVGIGKDVDQLTEADFDGLVAGLRQEISERRQSRPVAWEHSGDGEFPYRALVDGRTYTIRVNDFPDRPLYTLIIDDKVIEDLEDWPPAWSRAPIPQSLLDLLKKPEPDH